MLVSYAFKRVIRSWKLFTALLLGVTLSSILFVGINVGADTSAKQALDQQLSGIPIDIYASNAYGATLSSQNWSSTESILAAFDGVKRTEIISTPDMSIRLRNETRFTSFTVISIEENSRIYEGLTVINGTRSLGANETFLVLDSRDQNKIALGDNVTAQKRIYYNTGNETYIIEHTFTINVTLKVVGLVRLTEQALITALRNKPASFNLLIVDWDKTMAPINDLAYAKSAQSGGTFTGVAIYLDREALINPSDVSSSLLKLRALRDQMANKVHVGAVSYDQLLSALSHYQSIASMLTFTFLVTSLPVFFIAWYMTTTVSSVIFNLRRREIGLLLTKGLSKGQLLQTFLIETIIIGLIGAAAGVALSYLLTPLFVGTFGEKLSAPAISKGTFALAIVFSMIVTALAIFQPARKAANLKAMDALREYLFVQEERGYRKKLSWAAFILGSYKMMVLAVGFSVPTSPSTGMYGNIIMMILYAIALVLDNLLNYIGPLLFFWGLTKIFIIGSFKFQALASKATENLLGGFSIVSTKNVQRSPARVAAMAFLIALIVGHSVSVIGALSSEQDYTVRSICASVGSDLSVSLFSPANASEKMSQVAGLSKVSATTMEYTFVGAPAGESSVGSYRLIAVDPYEWLHIAYYEDEWFTGSSVADAFQAMASDNHTIILDRAVGKYLNLNVGDYVTIGLGAVVYRLKIVGFFGPERTLNQPVYIMSASQTEFSASSKLWSYVPYGLYEEVKPSNNYQAKVLAKLVNSKEWETVACEIQSFNPTVGNVYTIAAKLDSLQDDAILTSRINIQRVGVAFAVIAASIGTVLVVIVSLNERKSEICMMSVRGLSFRQLASILFAEDLFVALFSSLLGLFIGLLVLRGNVALANAQTLSLVARHIVFPLSSTLILAASLIAIFASVIVPVLLVVSKYLTQLDKAVRQA